MKISNKQVVIGGALAGMLILCTLPLSGCAVLGFLASPGAYEEKVAPVFDLQASQDRKILLWVECPRASGADYDLQKKLELAFTLYMTQRAGIDPLNLAERPAETSTQHSLDPVKIARELSAGYVLLVHVDEYDLTPLRIRDMYSGSMIVRAALLDTDTGVAVWPHQPEGKMLHNAVEMDSGGRDAVQSRLISGATHCVLRYLYPCDKVQFQHSTERVSTQQVFEIETY